MKHCPVCSSPLDSRKVRPLFTCCSCSWALSANVGTAFRHALVTGVIVECLLLLSLRLWFGNLLDTLDLWFGLQAALGVVVGGMVYERTLVVTPLRPQRAGRQVGTRLARRG